MKVDKEKADLAWEAALAYITKDGWPTREIDNEIADLQYGTWIRDTDEIWRTSGHRDRDLLFDPLRETFAKRYGEEGATARVIIFALLLECRARQEEANRAGRPEA